MNRSSWWPWPVTVMGLGLGLRLGTNRRELGGTMRRAMNPIPRARLRILLGAAVVLAGCTPLASRYAPRVAPESRERLDSGRRLEGQGDRRGAIDSYRAAIDASPEFIDAHRAYQNLVLAEGRLGDLIIEYREWLRRDETSPARHYLLGRLLSDRHLQLAAFERALALDPEIYFAHVGVGFVALESGDRRRAARAFDRALRIDPGRPEALRGRLRLLETFVPPADENEVGPDEPDEPDPHDQPEESLADDDPRVLGEATAKTLLAIDRGDPLAIRFLLNAHLAAGRRDAAFREALRFALEIGSEESAALLRDLLEKHGRQSQFELARSALGAGLASPPPTLEWTLLRADLERRCGDVREALRIVSALPVETAVRPPITRLRRELLLVAGDVDGYLEAVIEHRFGAGFDVGSETAEDELRAALAAWRDRGSAASPATVIATLSRHGLNEAAIEAGRICLAEHPTDSALREELAAALAHRRFVAELQDLFARSYREDLEVDFDGMLVEIRAASQRALGRDVVDPVVRAEYFPIGEFLDPDPAHGGGLARYFDRFGGFFLIGRRALGPIDGYLLRRIASQRLEIGGKPVLRVLGEDLEIASRLESSGGQIAGFALDSFIALNADRARAAADRVIAVHDAQAAVGGIERLLRDGIVPAVTLAERTSLSEPASVALRASLRSLQSFLGTGGKREQYAGVMLDAVESHERAHIDDARRFLPIHDDVVSKITLLADHSFSAGNVEAWLEERAQAVALVDARDPLAVLAEILRALPDRGAAPPHSVGYFDLASRMVTAIAREPSRYPEVDTGATIVQQLDRLGVDGLRRLGSALLLDSRSR
jgi:tetratricopeptide (TPR) repeat protein